MIALSESEGRRFGLKAGRVEADSICPEALRIAAAGQGYDWLVVRLPSGSERLVDSLRLQGLEPQQTDTLATWGIELERSRFEQPGLSPGWTWQPASAGDAEDIALLVRSVFERYPNHYTANPLLDPALALEGYVEWALRHIDGADRLCGVLRIDGLLAGFSCSRHEPSEGLAVGVLHGVHPSFSGRGVYRKMIEASLAHYQGQSYREFRIATQAGNLTVQNLWARLGFALLRNQITVHLMPLLGRTARSEAFPLPAGDPLAALQHFDAMRGDGLPLRRSLSTAGLADSGPAARLHSARLPRMDGGNRHTSVLTDVEGKALAWIHSDFAAPRAARD